MGMVRFPIFKPNINAGKKQKSSHPLPAMSVVNGSLPISDAWAGYLAHAQANLPDKTRLIILLLINIPVIAIILNVIRQLVSVDF